MARSQVGKFREIDLDAAIEQVEAAIDQEVAKANERLKKRQPRHNDAEKAAAAAAALKRWQTRAKRAQTFITKYRRRVNYYAKKLNGK
jgi:hypothetical protein